MEKVMDHEEIFNLMMQVLDDDAEGATAGELELHLQECPACAREWQALQAIHALLLQAPALSPAADFAQRTVALLPNSTHRVWALTGVYVLLLTIGFLPLALIVWLGLRLAPAFEQPAFVRILLQSGGQLLRLGGTVVAAGLKGFADLGELIGRQPAAIGWLLVMVGVILLWGGVYNQLTRPQRNIVLERQR
jgi:anti-sigma factor RsiW